MDDMPLVPDSDGKPFSAEVIDLAGIRVEWGRPASFTKRCDHRSLVFNRDERRVWCKDCERTLDGFDAFMVLNAGFTKIVQAANHKLAKAEEALTSTLVRRAAKEIDRTWRSKLAPMCPHCRQGLLPEDFERGPGAVSMELLRAKREKDKKP